MTLRPVYCNTALHAACGVCTLESSSLVYMFVHVIHVHVCVYWLFSGSDVLSALGLAFAIYLSLYPVALICPFILVSYKVKTLDPFHMLHIIEGISTAKLLRL